MIASWLGSPCLAFSKYTTRSPQARSSKTCSCWRPAARRENGRARSGSFRFDETLLIIARLSESPRETCANAQTGSPTKLRVTTQTVITSMVHFGFRGDPRGPDRRYPPIQPTTPSHENPHEITLLTMGHHAPTCARELSSRAGRAFKSPPGSRFKAVLRLSLQGRSSFLRKGFARASRRTRSTGRPSSSENRSCSSSLSRRLTCASGGYSTSKSTSFAVDRFSRAGPKRHKD